MTILKFLSVAAVAIAGAAVLPSQSKASEWGCQVPPMSVRGLAGYPLVPSDNLQVDCGDGSPRF